MKVENLTISKFYLKQLFEEFNPKILADGTNAKYSWFIYKNCEVMAPEYAKLMNELYDERREPEYPEIWKAQQELQEQFADRDEKGNVVTRNGFPVYTKHAKEYDEAFAKLRQDHKEFFEKLDKKDAVNREIFNQTVTIAATMLEVSEFPNNAKPFIVGTLGY
jgi:hypothetical protein